MSSSTSISSRQFAMYLGSFIASVLLVAAAYVGIIFLQAGVLESRNSEQLADIYFDKQRHLANFSSPKHVLIGGSNLLFSVSCAHVAEITRKPCFNGGTSAQPGLDYLLYKARNWLRPGDTAVLSLEWHHYTDPRLGYQQWRKEDSLPIVERTFPLADLWGWEPIFNRNAISYFLAADMDYFFQLGWREKALFLLGVENERVLAGLTAKLRGTRYQVTEALDNLEAKGTEAAARGDFERRLWQRLKPMRFPALEENFGVRSLRAFLRWCDEQGVEVLVTFPSTAHFAEYDQGSLDPLFQSVIDFYQREKTPILGRPLDFFYPPDWFFDTMYHLTAEKRAVHSQNLARLIKDHEQRAIAQKPPATTPLPFQLRSRWARSSRHDRPTPLRVFAGSCRPHPLP